MPSRNTFTIEPFRQAITSTIKEGMVVVDPFANCSKYGTNTNDLNPDFDTTYHMDALEFLKIQGDGSADVVLFDPPYSFRQASECYKNFGREKLSGDVTNMAHWSQCKDEIARILKPNGKVLTFGWNSNGVGKCRGMRIDKVILCAHGGGINDTICTIETKEPTIFDL